jgi:hypothetical protein
MAAEAFVEALAGRVQEVVAQSAATGARSLVLVDASRYARADDKHVPRCAWCGRIALGGDWIDRAAVPQFMERMLDERVTDGICPGCFSKQLGGASNELAVHAGTKETAETLATNLHDYEVRQRSDHVLAVEIPAHDASFVAHLLSRLADCVEAHRLDPVQVRIGGRSYVFTGR